MSAGTENNRYIVQVFVGALSQHYESLSVEAGKQTTSEEIVSCIVEKLSLSDSPNGCYELAEVIGDSTGQECKERRLGPGECPVALMLLWPKASDSQENYRFYLREKFNDCVWSDSFTMDPQLIRDYFQRFLYQPKDREYPDLCQLPDLNEQTLLDNLRARFNGGHIYTYVGSILIALNPFKFHPIYNPKYVKLYQNRRLGPELPPHIFAVADGAYHCMLKERRNQCIVISGESGSGKTESTNFLLHHLTALSQKGSHGSGVEQTILSAGPVLEAFGNAKTAHNNNSSRFGKFIQVNYKENGMVHGAVVQKYLLEKSRICSQGRNERNYHVFYYLLAGTTEAEKQMLHLTKIEDYHYLSRSGCYTLDNVDEKYEFSRLKQSMELVGFGPEKQRRLFSVLSAVLLLGNVEFQPRKSSYHHDEAVGVRNPEVLLLISKLLRVRQETLLAALTSKRARASGETLIINFKLPEAIAARDAMAKCLYGALFDWIVLQVNHALLAKKDTLREHQGNSIGVLDIFGFEDFGLCNSFEQVCINYANEHLQYYFNQHVFKYEQEEYRKEGIKWTNIDFMDNTGCLHLIEEKPSGLLCLLDDQCNFPGATNETLLQKFNSVHKNNSFYEIPQKREAAFIVRHYAGKVKYQVTEMREKNLDLMRQDIVGVLKNSSMAFVRELVGADPVAVFRWAIVRAFFRGYFAFHEAGRRHRLSKDGTKPGSIQNRFRNHTANESLISISPKYNCTANICTPPRSHYPYRQRQMNKENETEPVSTGCNQNRLSWPQFQQRNSEQRNKIREENAQICDRNASNRIVMEVDEREPVSPKRSILIHQNSSLDRVLCPNEAKVLERASQIVMKNKSFRPRERAKKGLKNLQTVKTLAGRTQTMKARKQPQTVTAQFQQSLHSLMDTLNHANPFFIRCIKSNAHKIPNKFDDDTVQRQLRYTGMLETVRIRQAGYNVRLTYDEFIQLYRILLPKGLVSSQADVRDFLLTLNLNRDNYQLGATKIFLRESEKVRLDYRLHQQIMASIVAIQRWARAVLERRRFLLLRKSAICIQSNWRSYHARSMLRQHKSHLNAALHIQSTWRGYRVHSWYRKLHSSLVTFQAHARGYLSRKNYQQLRERRAAELLVLSLEAATISQSSKTQIQNDAATVSQNSEVFDCVDRSNNMTGGNALFQHNLPEVPCDPQTFLKDPVVIQKVPPVFRMAESVKNLLESELAIQQPKKIPIKRTKGLNMGTHGNDGDLSTVEIERKGSSDSLTSQHSSDSQSGHLSKDTTLEKVKRHMQAAFTKAKRQDSWTTFTFSDGENDESKAVSPSTSAISEDQFLAAERSVSDIWQKRPNYSSNSPKSGITRSTPVGSGDAYHRVPRRDIIKPTQVETTLHPHRMPLKASISHDEQLMSTEPEAPVRIGRRNKVLRGVISRSVGEEIIDSAVTDTDSATFLGTIQETSVPNKGSYSQKHNLTREGSDRLTHSSYSSQESQLADENVYQKAGLLIHGVSHKRNRSGGITTLELKRRNSDPATKSMAMITDDPLGDKTSVHKSSDIEWKGNQFTIAGHTFRNMPRFSKEDKCVSCSASMDSVVNQGYKCIDCKQVFHTKCIQNGGVLEMKCPQDHRPGRRKHRKHSRTPYDLNKPGKFNVTKTLEFTDSTDKIISDAAELQLMQDFITKKIFKIESEEGEKPSEVDRVFKQALREFKDNLVVQYSVANKQGLNIKYRDLIANFLTVMKTVCAQEHIGEDFPVTMGVNAFRGFMNEFMIKTSQEKPSKTKRKKDKKRKIEDSISFLGHTFLLTIINIPTQCEVCSSFYMWPLERGLVCQNCKLTCHKKCYMKTSITCGKDLSANNSEGRRVFGAPLHQLAVGDGKIPVVVDRLITTIEMYGLYTEGIYRKPGVNSKVKELRTRIEEDDIENVKFENYNVHVLSSVLKSFLRDMPEPLLTFDSYEDFLRGAKLTDPQDRVSTLFAILKKLPKPNYDLMERLIFHLARVASQEEVNRMSASSLAIIFAPCILRTNKQVPAQESLNDISLQTLCVETIISEQLHKVKATLADIDTLDSACHTATHRLSSLRSSKIFSPEELQPVSNPAEDEEELLLMDHIQEIQKEKALLTSALPSLTRTISDDDLLSTDMDDGSLDDVTGRLDDIEGDGSSRKLRRPTENRMKLKRQSSSDNSVLSLYPPTEPDCDEDPIMV